MDAVRDFRRPWHQAAHDGQQHDDLAIEPLRKNSKVERALEMVKAEAMVPPRLPAPPHSVPHTP